MSRRSKHKHSAVRAFPALSGSAAGPAGKPVLPGVQSHHRWLTFAIGVALALAVWVVFGQTRHFEFVNFDDGIYVFDNPAVTQEFSWHHVGSLFTHPDGPDEWLPVTALSRMVDWKIHGPNAGGHHLTNVLLQAANAILLFLLLRKMTGALWRSAFVAAVFAIHPLHVQSVAWVTERKDVLSGLFFMLTLWAYVRYVHESTVPVSASTFYRESFRGSRFTLHATRYYCLALVFFALGLMAKTMLVTLPFVLLLLDYWPLQRFNASTLQRFNASPRHPMSGLLVEKIPFLVLSAAACLITMVAWKHLIKSVQDVDFLSRAGNACVAYAAYVGQMLYPVGLAVFYPHEGSHLSVWKIVLSALVLGIISGGVLAGWRKLPYLLVGWLWYLGMLVPVIGLVQVAQHARADHYTYLPQIGLYILITWGVVAFCGSWRHRRVVLASVAAVVLSGLMAAAYVQTGYWRNSVSLWTHTLDCTPENYVAHHSLGIALAEQGNVQEAIEHYTRALQLAPDNAGVLIDLANALAKQGHRDEAIQDYLRALQSKPDSPEAQYNLGDTLAAQGQLAEAIQRYQLALQLRPDYPEAYCNLGIALADQGRWDEAIPDFERALQLNPDFAEAHNNLGAALANQGRLDEAVLHYETALKFKPDYADAHINLGVALGRQGKWPEAIQQYERAIQINPDSADAHRQLGLALAVQGNLAPAVQEFKQTLQLKPDDANTRYYLALALAGQGEKAEAVSQLQQALDLATAQGNAALAQTVRARLQPNPPPQPPTR
jgi:tetratricopeptide (TPR) repeat protein